MSAAIVATTAVLASTKAKKAANASDDAAEEATESAEVDSHTNAYSHARIAATGVCVWFWVCFRVGQDDEAGSHKRSRDLHCEGRFEMSREEVRQMWMDRRQGGAIPRADLPL